MRRTNVTIALAVALVATGCTDSLAPTRSRTGPKATLSVPTESDVRASLSSLFPPPLDKGIANAASTQLTNVYRSLANGQRKPAQQQAAALCNFVEKQQAAGRLVAGKTLADVDAFCNDMFTSVALTGTSLELEDAIAVFVPVDAPDMTVVVPSHKAGVFIPTGAFGEDVTVIIAPYAPEARPLATSPNRQFPFFFEFQSVPAVPHFARNVNVGVCTDEDIAHPGNTIVLAHNVNNTVEALPFVSVDFLQCEPVPTFGMSAPKFDRQLLFSRELFAFGASAARHAGSMALRALTPTSAYATNKTLSGSTGSFSPFGGYYGGQIVGLSPSTIDYSDYVDSDGGGVTFAPSIPGLECSWFRSSNPSAGSFDGDFYPSSVEAPVTTTITAICDNSYVAEQVVTITP